MRTVIKTYRTLSSKDGRLGHNFTVSYQKIMQAKIPGAKARTTVKVRNLQKNVRKKTFMTVVARA
jgi:hypothetical protein